MSMPSLDPDLLKTFVAVADQRSFTRAAVMLNRTQSAVSMQIKRLEARLDVELFNRTKVNVDLSAAGERLLGYARRILALNDEAVGRMAERKIEGVVRLGVMDDYGIFIVPPLLASFLAGYPRIHVEMETGLTSSMPARLGEAYDLVIAMHPAGRGANKRSGRPALLERLRRRSRYPSHFTRKAACFGNGQSRRSTLPNVPGGWHSSVTAWQRWSRSRLRVSR
jgi:DNA-binding transcriptional LysR family regulator